jgi:hypothetical protein
MTFDVDGPKATVQPKAGGADITERLPAPKPHAALPAPTTPEPPKKPSGGKPTLRRIK